MIRVWMRTISEKALWRIVEAPPEKWTDTRTDWIDEGGRRCLCGHAEAWYRDDDDIERCGDRRAARGRHVVDSSLERVDQWPASRYPSLVARVGLDRARRLCQNAAMKEILSRSGVRVTHNYARLAEHALEPDASRERDPGLEWDRDPTPYAEAEEAYRREPW